MKPTPFEIRIPEADLADLQTRLANTRLAPDPGNADWRYGTEASYLAELLDYWRDGYDWRAHEAQMNAFSHYRVEIEGVPVHFLREPGRGPFALLEVPEFADGAVRARVTLSPASEVTSLVLRGRAADGELVFSKQAQGRFPEDEEVLGPLRDLRDGS